MGDSIGGTLDTPVNRFWMCEVTVRITASDLRLPRWQSTRSFLTPSSSMIAKSSRVCLKSRVSWPARIGHACLDAPSAAGNAC